MKTLITLSVSALLVSACSSGGSSSGGGVASSPTITNPSSSVYSQMIENHFYLPVISTCERETPTSSLYFKRSFSKSNNEFTDLQEFYQDSSCTSLVFYGSQFFSFVSYTDVNGEQRTSFTLIDAQMSIVDNDFLNLANTQQFYGLTWISSNAQSIIDKKFQSSDSAPKFVSGTIKDYLMRQISNSIFINGIQYQ